MADILVDQGVLDTARRAVLEGLVAEHLRMHGDDPEKSLAAIDAGRSTRARLTQIDDPELAYSVAFIGNGQSSPRLESQPTVEKPRSEGGPGRNHVHLLAEQHDRWERGERVLVESFLERDPGLKNAAEPLLDLIYNEIILREQRGEAPGAEEYMRRFPDLGAAIKAQFEIHGMFAEQESSWGGNAPGSASFSVGTSSSSGLRFRVLRPHARGGLGAVFVALDTELHREVAVKQILDRLADDPTSRRRFLVEAEIAGGLEHPGIVPVYGVGSYANGRPYYAMRFIRGDSLKDAVNRFHSDLSLKGDPGRRLLELQKLLRRFLDVCNAIEYAHSRGVLHRDLKPGNIIVGMHGETLVVDWGLAKSVGAPIPARRLPSEHWSPRRPVEVPRPFRRGAGNTGFHEPGTGHRRHRPPGPAFRRVQLGRDLVRGLDGPSAVCGSGHRRGARSGVERRIRPTAKARAMGRRGARGDLLEGDGAEPRRPLQLGPSNGGGHRALDGRRARLGPARALARPRRPLARRHRTLVTTAAAVLVLGIIGLSTFAAVVGDKNRKLVAANAATGQAERLADARLDRAVASIENYFTDFGEDALKGGQLAPELRDRLLAKPRQFYEQLAAEINAKANPTDRERALLAQGLRNLGRILSILGRNKEARAESEAAVASFAALVNRHPAVVEYQTGLANSQSNLGVVLAAVGESGGAVDAYKKAGTIFEALTEKYPNVADYQSGLASNHTKLGNVLLKTGRSDLAALEYTKAVSIYETLAGREPENPEYQNGLANTHTSLGPVYAHMRRPDLAEASFTKGIAIGEPLVASHPEVAEYQNRLARSYTNLGVFLYNSGRLDLAASAYKKAITLREALVAREPDVPDYQNGLASSYGNLVLLWPTRACSQEAAEAYQKAIKIREALVASHPDVPEYQSGLANSHGNLANALAALRRLDLAAGEYEKAISIGEALTARQPGVPEYMNVLANSYKNYGILVRDRGNLTEALAKFNRAARIAPAGSPAGGALPVLIRDAENYPRAGQSPTRCIKGRSQAQRCGRRAFVRSVVLRPIALCRCGAAAAKPRWPPTPSWPATCGPSRGTTPPARPRWPPQARESTSRHPMNPPRSSSAARRETGSLRISSCGPMASSPGRLTARRTRSPR